MLHLLFAFVIGCAIPLQAVVNNQLKPHLDDSTIMAAPVSFAVGTIGLAWRVRRW